jgi:GrpB-like predicted nucleotidyltransferase (UPF0157 family)
VTEQAERLAALGLGLDHGALRVEVTPDTWVAAGSTLRDEVGALLGGDFRVEHVGSTSIAGLAAKPIIDLAIGLPSGDELPTVRSGLEQAGWIYGGDAGNDGGHVFLLEDRPEHRVAHAHAVGHPSQQWDDYLRLREVLRGSSEARQQYGQVKRRLILTPEMDRKGYTDGKTDVVLALLSR